MRRVGVAGLSLVGVFGAASAFAADPPVHKPHPAHVKAPALPTTKTAPVQGSPGSHVMLNPQPIPPGKTATPVNATGGSKVMLNTQPIPPGKSTTGPVNASGGSKVMLNTQPIPPGKSTTGPKLKTAPRTAPVVKTAG
jgi:hypothetical protein